MSYAAGEEASGALSVTETFRRVRNVKAAGSALLFMQPAALRGATRSLERSMVGDCVAPSPQRHSLLVCLRPRRRASPKAETRLPLCLPFLFLPVSLPSSRPHSSYCLCAYFSVLSLVLSPRLERRPDGMFLHPRCVDRGAAKPVPAGGAPVPKELPEAHRLGAGAHREIRGENSSCRHRGLLQHHRFWSGRSLRETPQRARVRLCGRC